MSEQEKSAEETREDTRVEMRRRFDAANAEAKNRRQVRYDARGTRQAEEDKRWARPTREASDDTPEVGENDSSGG
ncbi:MAG: hypothetical protein WCD37_13235 [Chloroflexia bacterium]